MSFRLLSVATTLLLFLCIRNPASQAQKAHFTIALAHPPGGGGITPYGLAVDGKGKVYVADDANYVYDLHAPYQVAVDGVGNVYWLYQLLGRVEKQGVDGSRVTLPLGPLAGPSGIAVDDAGDVFVADSGDKRILEAIPSGKTYVTTVLPMGPFNYPTAMSIDGSGNLYIVDGAVLKETFSGGIWIRSVVAKNSAFSIAADRAGNVYLLDFSYADPPQPVVLKETLSNGVYIESSMVTSGQNPYALATDPAGNLYMNSPLLVGTLEEFAGLTSQFLPVRVTSTSLTASIVFTIDTQTTLGAPLVLTQGNAGLDFALAPGGSCGNKPASYIYNPGDTCFVNVVFGPRASGSRFGAVVLQDASGVFIASAYLAGTGTAPQISFPPGSLATMESGLKDPTAVAVDAAGNVFFSDIDAGVVYKETLSTTNGSYTRSIVTGGLPQPLALGLDGAGNVYIATAGGIFKERPSQAGYLQTQIPTDLHDLTGIPSTSVATFISRLLWLAMYTKRR